MTDSTERLISSLAADLEPVQPLPRLRSAFAGVLAVSLAILGLVLLGDEAQSGFASILSDRIYLTSFISLLIAAFAGTTSALAAAVPGRHRLELGGILVAWLGLASAALACLIGMRALGLDAPASPAGLDAMCFRRAWLYLLLPAAAILSFVARGWAAHPLRAASIALLGSGAIGAGIVHASCGFAAPEHLLIGHLSVPIALLLLGLYPLSLILRRIGR